MDLALNNLQRLICIKPNKPNRTKPETDYHTEVWLKR